MRDKFKKFDGDKITDIVEYIKENLERDPNITISVGCDSVQRRRKTIYAITVMIYNTDIRNGAHVVFFRENVAKVRDHFDRLQRESQYALDVAKMIDDELSPMFKRQDLSLSERKRYKFHLMKSTGKYSHVPPHYEDSFTNALILTESERDMEYKLVDIHVDYNPFEGVIDKKGIAKNKSNMSYKTCVPWIRSMGYRVFSKNIAFASTSAADLLLKK